MIVVVVVVSGTFRSVLILLFQRRGYRPSEKKMEEPPLQQPAKVELLYGYAGFGE